MDLIEVAPQAKPPVCRITNYGKLRYEARKKAKEAQKKQKQTEMKSLRVRPNTDDHDIQFKMKNARKFLEKGNKVKFTVIFRGPELRHKEIGQHQLELFIEGTKDIGVVYQPPRMEGRRMTMLLDPLPEAQREKAKQESAKQEEERVAQEQATEHIASPTEEPTPDAPAGETLAETSADPQPSEEQA